MFSKQQGYFSVCGRMSNPRKWIAILFSYHPLRRNLITNARIIGGVVVLFFPPHHSKCRGNSSLSSNLNESRWIQTRCFLVLFPLTNCSSPCSIECPRCNDQLVFLLLEVNIHGSGSKLYVYFSNCFIVEFG